MKSTLLKIYLRPEKRLPVIAVSEAEAIPGTGLAGDHLKCGSRQVTILSKKAWDSACNQLGKPLDPALRRANLLVDSIDLKESKGKILQVGSIKIKITGETKPCRLMDESEMGLKDALVPDWRGGVFGEVLNPGKIVTGDTVTFVDE